jgi:hypothetical protein
MGRSKPSETGEAAKRAFERVGGEKLLAALRSYAVRKLGFAPAGAATAGVDEELDLVGALVVKGYACELEWDLPDGATDEEVIAKACSKMRGMRSTLRRKAARHQGDADALDEVADGAPGADELLHMRRVVEDVPRVFAHDPEASAHFALMLGGAKRCEIMDELRCTERRAETVRERIRRGLAAYGDGMNDEREDEPPSSGPRGRCHEPQATEERQGAPPEPRRGARRTGRGR